MLEKYYNLLYKESIQFKRNWPQISFEIEDLFDEAVFKLLHCISKWREDKQTKFITYLTVCIRNHFLTITKNERNLSIDFMPDEELPEMPDPKNPIAKSELSEEASAFWEVASTFPAGLQNMLMKNKHAPIAPLIASYIGIPASHINDIKVELQQTFE